MKLRILYITMCSMMVLQACKGDVKNPKETNKNQPKPRISVNFNADSAYQYVAEQVAFGPRVPKTEAHNQTMYYLKQRLAEFCDTSYIVDGMHGKIPVFNVVGSFNVDNPNRFALAAHWDTRPHADEDSTDFESPADGANDGASGVGVLLEIARQLQQLKPSLGIDIIFFDQEDGGSSGDESSWCIGSQNWSSWALENGYEAQNGILLDMVGAKGATFGHEANSTANNQNLVVETWKTGQDLGYGGYFLNIRGNVITDDHVYMHRYAGIPTIDIIHFDLNTRNSFPEHWHTQKDNMDVIDKNTLKAVGHTVLHVVMNHN